MLKKHFPLVSYRTRHDHGHGSLQAFGEHVQLCRAWQTFHWKYLIGEKSDEQN